MFSFTGNRDYPYWRLSAFYLFYCTCLGSWIPYWPLYVEHIGHSAVVIGLTGSIFHSTRIIAPNLWGYITDVTGKRLELIRYGCLLAFISILGMFLGTEVWLLICVVFLFSFFWAAVLPQFEALTLDYMGPERAQNYGRVRLWGSIGFILAVFACGWLFGRWPMSLFPWVLSAVMLSIWISSLIVPRQPTREHANSEALGESFWQIASQYHVWGYLVAFIFMQASFGPYYNFFSILLKDNQYPLIAVSLYWSVAVIAEVTVFIFMQRLYGRFSLRWILLGSTLLGALRWAMTAALPENIWWMGFAQMLHAFSFGTFHACMIEFIRRTFSAKQQGRGQAMFSSLGYGVGAVLGALGSGLLWAHIGHLSFYVAAGFALIAFICAFFATRHANYH